VRSHLGAACGTISVVLRLGLLALPALAAGCTGEIVSELSEGKSPAEAIAIEKWGQKALPVFTGTRTKCVTCHDGSMANAPAYLAGTGDLARRETLIAFMPRVVNLGAPQSSRMLTVGDHTAMGGGLALLSTEASDCLEWVNAERAARPPVDPIRTAKVVPMLCTAGNPGDATCPINTIDLAGLGPTPVEATVTFTVNQLGPDSYYTNLKVKAGAQGVYMEHPLLETWPAGEPMPTTDPIDRFFAVVVNLQANQEMTIGSGTATLAGFAATDEMSIRFELIEKVRPAI
jgi:hypothetical protein